MGRKVRMERQEVRRKLEEIICPSVMLGRIPTEERVGDEGDQAVVASEREAAAAMINQKTIQVVLAGITLKLLKAGYFGICLRCGDNILPKRIEAACYSPFCLTCHGQFERWLEGRGFVPDPSILRRDLLRLAAKRDIPIN